VRFRFDVAERKFRSSAHHSRLSVRSSASATLRPVGEAAAAVTASCDARTTAAVGRRDARGRRRRRKRHRSSFIRTAGQSPSRNVHWPRPSVWLSVPRRIPILLHGPGSNLGNSRRCRLVVPYWADSQSVHGFRCCDTTAPNAKCQRVLVLRLCLVLGSVQLSSIHFSTQGSQRL